jgi:hypothetical protein
MPGSKNTFKQNLNVFNIRVICQLCAKTPLDFEDELIADLFQKVPPFSAVTNIGWLRLKEEFLFQSN